MSHDVDGRISILFHLNRIMRVNVDMEWQMAYVWAWGGKIVWRYICTLATDRVSYRAAQAQLKRQKYH